MPEQTIDLGDSQYAARRFDADDWEEFLDWARDEYILSITRKIAKLPKATQEGVTFRALNEALAFSLTSEYVQWLLDDIRGAARTTWMAIRHNNGAPAYDQVLELMQKMREQLKTEGADNG